MNDNNDSNDVMQNPGAEMVRRANIKCKVSFDVYVTSVATKAFVTVDKNDFEIHEGYLATPHGTFVATSQIVAIKIVN